jgi:hypothetical protein
MTRKRSSYRPKQNLKDPVNYVLSGLRLPPKTIIDTVRTMNHLSLNLIRTGKGTKQDIGTLNVAMRIAKALTSLGIGEDWSDEINTAVQALDALDKREKIVFTGPELTSVNLAMQVHDLQLDASSVINLEKALALCKPQKN